MVGKTLLKWSWAGLLVLTPVAVAAPPKAKVSLVPSVSAVAPGQAFDVGIRFELAEGWHIYWKNAGDSGLAPKIEWHVPAGFTVGELRFPAPKPHDDPGGFQTNVLEGNPVLIQTLTAPKDLPVGEPIKLAADLTWLVCQKQCLMEKGSVSAEFSTVAATDAVKPANEPVFKRAYAALPVPPDKAKYVKVTPSASAEKLAPGQEFDVRLDVTVLEGHHVQSNRPAQPSFIGTHVFMEAPEEVSFGKVEYPPAKERSHPQLGKISEYHGTVQFRVPGAVQNEVSGSRVRIGGLLTAQACNDKTGVCYPPENVEWSLELPLSTGTARASDGTPDVAQSEPEARVQSEPEARAPGGRQGAGQEAEAIDPAQSASSDEGGLQAVLERLGLPGLLLGCFLYGLFINATPCVLPLLSIKVLGFVQQAHESRKRTAALGLAFGAGVILFFIVLGFLAAAGSNVLQFPAAVIALGAVVTAMALSMLGVFTLQPPMAATKLEATIQKEGMLASFGKGSLAPVLGFACTGPFMAAMFGWATQQEWKLALVAFLLTGLGMASPYVVLGANPKWLSFLPKPGHWMVTFERVMGFLLLGMVLWLIHPLTAQIGVEGYELTLGFLVVVAMACWLLGKVDFNMTTLQRWRYRGGAVTMVLVAGLVIYGWALQKPATAIAWQPWSAQAVEETVRSGKTAFVDFTAAYCTQCKVNKAVAINTPEVQRKLQDLGAAAFQADFTSGDPEIFEILQAHDRAGVPMNLIYPAGKPEKPILLEPALTKDYLLRKLDEAGPSTSGVSLASARSENG